MGLKVEGVRSDERVRLTDSTQKNRKLLIGGVIGGLVLLVILIVVMMSGGGSSGYGSGSESFRVSFTGSPTQSATSQLSSGVKITSSVSNVQSWRYGNAGLTEMVQSETVDPTDNFLGQGVEAVQILQPELPGSTPVTINGLSGVEVFSTSGGSGLSAAFPYSDTALLLDGNTLFVVSAAGDSKSDVTGFVHSFSKAS